MQDKSPLQTAQKDVEGTQTVFVKTLTGSVQLSGMKHTFQLNYIVGLLSL